MRQHVRYLLALVSVMGCGHTDPFTDPDNTEHGPFAPGTPLRLTYNVGLDAYPFYLPGDSLIAYAFQRPDASNQSQCFGVLPAGGGTTVSESCPRTAASLDSTERFEVGAPLTADSVVLVQALRRAGAGRDDFGYIGRAAWADAATFSVIQRFPFTTPNGSLEFTPSHLAVTGDGNVAYLATREDVACPGSGTICDTTYLINAGLEVGSVPLAGGAATVLSGTSTATSVAPGRTVGSIIFTLPLDTRVFERDASGVITVLVDMQLGPAARDVMLRGNKVVGITGGDVALFTWIASGLQVQVASPGDITMVDVTSGVVTLLSEGGWRRPALSHDGTHVVAQDGDGATDIFVVPAP